MTLDAMDGMRADLKELLKRFDALNDVREACGKKRLSDTSLGAYAVNNTLFIVRLRAQELTFARPATVNRARAWLKAEGAKYKQKRGRK